MLGRYREHCRNVSELKLFYVDPGLGQEVLNLSVSYFEQLMKFEMGPRCVLSPFQLEEVARQCPIADFDMSVGWIELACVIHILGNRLVSVSISGG